MSEKKIKMKIYGYPEGRISGVVSSDEPLSPGNYRVIIDNLSAVQTNILNNHVKRMAVKKPKMTKWVEWYKTGERLFDEKQILSDRGMDRRSFAQGYASAHWDRWVRKHNPQASSD